MSVTKAELIAWLDTLADDQEIGVDEGGLTLQAMESPDGTAAYLEIGGMPERSGDGPPYDSATATGMYDRDF